MPFITDPAGVDHWIPGVYTDTKVISDLPGPLPAFQIPVIVGSADKGHPYNATSLKYSEEGRFSPFKLVKTSSACARYFGADSHITRALAWAKKHGLPFAYAVCASALTRASVPAHSAGPIVQGQIYSRKFGAEGGHIKLKVTGGTTVEITPVKRSSLLTASALITATRIYVKDNSWIVEGNTYYIGDNNTTDAAYVIDSKGSELSSTGQVVYYVELTTGLAGAIDTAQYGMILEWEAAPTETPDAFADVQEMLDWFNEESEILGFHKEAGTFTNPAALIAIAAATPLKEIAAWGVVVSGASPAATLTEHQGITSDLDTSEWDQFALDYELLPQAFLVVSGLSTIHSEWNTWAGTKRAEGYPVSITAGTAWGDIVIAAGNDTDPIFRARALNSQDTMLVAGGLDKLDAYLSHAPAVFGRRVAGGVGHNLTNDELLCSEVETMWDERGSGELTDLHKGGVTTYRLQVSRGVRFVISQGLSTLQSNTQAWNEGTDDTPLVMQRDLADFVERVLREDLDGTQIGADEVDASTIGAVIVRRADKSLVRKGYIKSFTIASITKNVNGAGYDVDWSVKLRGTNDYINLTTNILIGEE